MAESTFGNTVVQRVVMSGRSLIERPRRPRRLGLHLSFDRRLYDHASVPATLEALFGLDPLTERGKAKNTILPLLALDAPRTDAPQFLPNPASLGIGLEPLTAMVSAGSTMAATPVSRPGDSINDGNLPVVVYAALRQDLEISRPSQRADIIAKVASLKTRNDAAQYMDSVRSKLAAARSVPKQTE